MLNTAQDCNAIVFSDFEGFELGRIIVEQLWDECVFESVSGEVLPIAAGYVIDDETMQEIVQRNEYEVYIVGTTEIVIDAKEAQAGYVTRVYAVDGSGTWDSRCLACFCEPRWEPSRGEREISLELYQGGDEEHPLEDLYDLVLWEDSYAVYSR